MWCSCFVCVWWGGTWETRKVYDEKPDKIERERGGGEGKGEEGRA